MNDLYARDKDRIDRADQLGLAFVKTLILLNGGAIIAVLTCLGNASTQTVVGIEVPSIVWAIALFLVSILLSLAALGVSYTFYGVNEDHPYHRFWNNWIVPFNTVAMLAALFGFAAGVITLLCGVTEIK